MTTKSFETHVRNTSAGDVNYEEGIIGMCSESGEVLDILKKYNFQGHEIDRAHLIEEIGDVLWYLTETALAIDCTLEDIMDANVKKIKKRYPDGFSVEKSVNREAMIRPNYCNGCANIDATGRCLVSGKFAIEGCPEMKDCISAPTGNTDINKTWAELLTDDIVPIACKSCGTSNSFMPDKGSCRLKGYCAKYSYIDNNCSDFRSKSTNE